MTEPSPELAAPSVAPLGAHCDGAAATSALYGMAESVEPRLFDDSRRGGAWTLHPAERFVWAAYRREARAVERCRFAWGAWGPSPGAPGIRPR
jgi:hypothetical protein